MDWDVRYLGMLIFGSKMGSCGEFLGEIFWFLGWMWVFELEMGILGEAGIGFGWVWIGFVLSIRAGGLGFDWVCFVDSSGGIGFDWV